MVAGGPKFKRRGRTQANAGFDSMCKRDGFMKSVIKEKTQRGRMGSREQMEQIEGV